MPKGVVRADKFQEWIESPVAEVVLKALKHELDAVYNERAELFIPGKAEETQEVRSNLIGQESVLKDMIELFSGNKEILSEYFEKNDILVIYNEVENGENRS